MRCLAAALLSLLCSICALAQSTTSANIASDSQAITLAKQSLTALTGGVVISDVTLSGTVISAFSTNQSQGTITLSAKGWAKSRIDVTVGQDTRSEARILVNGVPSGFWKANSSPAQPIAQHNCWTDAAWFFPVLSSLTQVGSSSFVLTYVGQEQHSGVDTQHIKAWQATVGQQLSGIDVYLDSVSHLPVAVAFNTHPDNDVNTSMAIEINFSSYQAVNGIQVPFQIQRTLNGNPVLQITLTGAVFNTGILDSLFNL